MAHKARRRPSWKKHKKDETAFDIRNTVSKSFVEDLSPASKARLLAGQYEDKGPPLPSHSPPW